MSIDINRLTVLGTVCSAPERRDAAGKEVVNFRVVAKGWNGRESYISVGCWNAFTQGLAEQLAEGDRVLVEGSVSARGYKNRDDQIVASIECSADRITRDESGEGGGSGSRDDRGRDSRDDDRGRGNSGGSRSSRYEDEDRDRGRGRDSGGSRDDRGRESRDSRDDRDAPRSAGRGRDRDFEDDGDDPFARA